MQPRDGEVNATPHDCHSIAWTLYLICRYQQRNNGLSNQVHCNVLRDA
jgi:hypothetical protein